MDGSHATLLAAVLLLGCGATATAPATPAPAPLAGPPRPWAELSRDERRQHMVREVFPRTSAMFAEHDAERYADDFSCATCHGPDAEARSFAMPNPALYPLSPTGSERQHQTVRDHPEMVRFMYGRLVPAMETMLGAATYDETTGEGFTCYACHPHAADEEPSP